ncbi:hypothetical protein PG994_014198 [Apiospora phragmitis]|uniref:Uncharacterized protein n=1 Tax=Apiospora phragmitis TaxID=2905665 RepID=A0ABR1T3M4_9PEZI
MVTQTPEKTPTSSRTSTYVSTMPGGAETTITTVEVVTGEAAAATPTNDGSGGALQTGNPAPYHGAPIYKVMAGVVAVGGVFLV